MEEWNDIYDKNRNLTGRRHRRGEPCQPGEYDFAVCVWVYDGRGNFLLTRRASAKSFPGTWENSGGMVLSGETSRTAIVRELWEETGIAAEAEAFLLLEHFRHGSTHYDHYGLKWDIPVSEVRLLEGETDAVKWASFSEVHRMISAGEICEIIGKTFFRLEEKLRTYNMPKNLF